jgi:hypothetical protein
MGEFFTELPDFGRDHERTVRLLRIIAEVILVIGLGAIER